MYATTGHFISHSSMEIVNDGLKELGLNQLVFFENAGNGTYEMYVDDKQPFVRGLALTMLSESQHPNQKCTTVYVEPAPAVTSRRIGAALLRIHR
jgi:5-formaminoimidazole-4-carboxamide-1-beta-D-ribofuranosyl 5'-monophosphate synthetase